MGYRLAVNAAPDSDAWSVALRVDLNLAESNNLFLSGDAMLAWPFEGVKQGLEHGGESRLERSGMFISEVASRPFGLQIRYSRRGQAERAAALLRRQLADMGIQEVC